MKAMGTKNDFIKIDELFRDLKYGEEREPAEAWPQMKQVLDAEMPVGLERRYYRRYLFLLLALLIAGGAATYYTRMNNGRLSFFNKTHSEKGQSLTPGDILPVAIQTPKHAQSEAAEKTMNDPVSENKAGTKETILASTAKSLPPASTTPIHHGSSNEDFTGSTGVPVVKSLHSTGRLAGQEVTSRTKKERLEKISTLAPGIALTSKHNTSKYPYNAVAKNIIPPVNGAAINNSADREGSSSAIIEQRKIIEKINPKTGEQLSADKNLVHESKGKNTGDPVTKEWLPAGNHESNIVKNKNGQYYREEKDTIKQYEITRKQVIDPLRLVLKKLEMDTVSIVTIERTKYTPLPLMNHRQTWASANGDPKISKTVFASSNEAKTATLVPLADFKVKSKKMGPNALSTLKSTTNGIAGIFNGSTNWYAAILLGGNASFDPGAFGLQAGIAVFYTFAERWTASAGIQFMNHYFPNYTLADQATSYAIHKTNTPVGWQYSGIGTTVTNRYSVENINSLDFPVFLSYNLNVRLSVFGGPLFSYGLPLKWTKESTVNNLSINETVNGNSNPFSNTDFQIKEGRDLGARFGIGYIAGLSYDLSRNLSLDMRIRQALWNNKRISLPELNKMFRSPSLQLSVGYYFGRKEKVTYILDSRRR